MSVLSAAILIFSFQFSLFFSIYQSPGRINTAAYYWFWYAISHQTLLKIWVVTFLVQNVQRRGDSGLILTVKMETRHPVQSQFGSEFPAICNHCVVMTAWSHRETRKFWAIFAFFGGPPLTVKFSKFCSEGFHCLTDWSCCVEISWNLSDGKSVKLCVIYLTNKNKISAASQTVATVQITPKICQG